MRFGREIGFAIVLALAASDRASASPFAKEWKEFLNWVDGRTPAVGRCRSFLLPPGEEISKWGRTRLKIAADRMRATFLSTDGKIKGATKAATIDPLGEYDGLWIRDNAINFKEVAGDPEIEEAYISFCKSNLAQETLGRNGEPKFNADGTPFNKPWGRPQNDGPGYRALRWMEYIDKKLAKGLTREALENYSPSLDNLSVKWDLEYLAHHWRDSSFDLWEEEMGSHFHTLAVMMDALEKGAKLAAKLEPDGAGSAAATMYRNEAAKIREFILKESWDPKTKRLRSTWRHTGGFVHKKEPLDISLILGLLHTTSEPPVYALSNEHVMAYMATLEERFSEIYRINEGLADASNRGVAAIGRYPEDVFHGGNPWVIATQGAAEYYYKLGSELRRNGEVVVTEWNEKFFRRLMGNDSEAGAFKPGARIRRGSPAFVQMLAAIEQKGDGFLDIIRRATPEDGFNAEQIGRGYRDGDQGPWVENYLKQFNGDLEAARKGGNWIGAQLLVWNEASLRSAVRARTEFIGRSTFTTDRVTLDAE